MHAPGISHCLPAAGFYRHSAHQLPAPLSHLGCQALWETTHQSLGSLVLRAEMWSSHLLAPPPHAVIYWYPMALDSSSSHSTAVLEAIWRREAVAAPVVTGVRPGDITSPYFLCSDLDAFVPLAASPPWPQRRCRDLIRSKQLNSSFLSCIT